MGQPNSSAPRTLLFAQFAEVLRRLDEPQVFPRTARETNQLRGEALRAAEHVADKSLQVGEVQAIVPMNLALSWLELAVAHRLLIPELVEQMFRTPRGNDPLRDRDELYAINQRGQLEL